MRQLPPPNRLVDITYSEVNAFIQCPLKWFLHYGQNLAPRSVKPILGIGSLVHAWLGWIHSPELNDRVPTLKESLDAFDRATAQIEAERGLMDPQGRVRDTSRGVVERYLDWWILNRRGITTLATEVDFNIPIFSWVPSFHLEGTLHGRIDWIFTKGKQMWVVDHKCVKRFSPNRYLYSMQGPVYALGVTKAYKRAPTHVGYSLIRRVASKTGRPDVQVFTVQMGPRELHLTEENLAKWMRQMKMMTSMELAAGYGADCSWKCNYLPICEVLRHGQDPKPIVKGMFYVREPQKSEAEGSEESG